MNKIKTNNVVSRFEINVAFLKIWARFKAGVFAGWKSPFRLLSLDYEEIEATATCRPFSVNTCVLTCEASQYWPCFEIKAKHQFQKLQADHQFSIVKSILALQTELRRQHKILILWFLWLRLLTLWLEVTCPAMFFFNETNRSIEQRRIRKPIR